jgi:hypothetical protein
MRLACAEPLPTGARPRQVLHEPASLVAADAATGGGELGGEAPLAAERDRLGGILYGLQRG